MSKRINSNDSKLQAVRNPQGLWINTALFSEEAIHFKKHGYYCADPRLSPSWREYWDEQLRRCKEGYIIGGVRITGHHYNYLNFTQIKRTKVLKGNIANKVVDFPDFWDGDYNYFHCLEIARNGCTLEEYKELQLSVIIRPEFLVGGYHMIVGKARRKGYSYKNGSICANIYNTIPNSTTLIGAFLKEYLFPEGTMSMASEYINFYNEYCGWGKAREFKDKEDYRRASYAKTLEDGNVIESGYKSSIRAISFKDNPDAARGKDSALLLLEESGKFPNLEDSYMATEATTRSGRYITGQMIIFGTGGDMQSDTIDFANMFYNAELYNLLPFTNIWDENALETNCGFFHPMYWNNDGYYDKDGNSNTQEAIDDENKERERLRTTSGGTNVIQKRVQEYPFNPSEAFLTVSTNDFPTIELRNRLNVVIREKLHTKFGQPVILYKDDNGKVRAKPDLAGVLTPNWHRVPNDNPIGAVVIYEYPIENAPKGLYKVCYDPTQQDIGTSCAAMYVKKGYLGFSATNDIIVASYVGRMATMDAMHKICEMFCELYNAEAMHENMVSDVINYFRQRKKLYLLAAQPDQVISKAIKNSGVSRVYGCHMNEDLKKFAAALTKRWMLKERDVDENGRVLTNIDFICDPGWLEEAILWNMKGNFDRMSAWFMLMIQQEEDDMDKIYDINELKGNLADLASLKNDLFKRS